MDITTDCIKRYVYENVNLENDCGDCKHLVVVNDAFNTGDSPTVYDCNSDCFECPIVSDFICKAADTYSPMFLRKQVI